MHASNVPERVCGGPSARVVAWRGFLVETILCVVLLAAIGAITLHADQNITAGAAIIAIAGTVITVVRRQ